MKTIELWSGKASFSKVAAELGHETWKTDINPAFDCDLIGDVLDENIQKKIMQQVKTAHIVWMSPVCTFWSLAAGNTYWTEYRMPRNEKAFIGIKMMMFARFVADYCVKHNKIFFIENPNGRAVWIMDNKYLKRVWYCQYGDTRAKPTNIWSNLKIDFKVCSNNNPDCNHIRAIRGSKTGTQGIKSAADRSMIPSELFQHIFKTIGDLK